MGSTLLIISVKIAGFKYLVVKTGYTSRLIEKLFELSDQLEEDDPILYIEDENLFRVSRRLSEIDQVREMIPEDRGIIVLRCNSLSKAMALVDTLMNQRYCAFFTFGTLYQMELINQDILMMTFDCESG